MKKFKYRKDEGNTELLFLDVDFFLIRNEIFPEDKG